MTICGIDPGLSGALAFIGPDGETQVEDMPTVALGKRNTVDGAEVSRLLRSWKTSHVFIERQHAFPKQGGVSNFTIGCGFGVLCGVMDANGVPYEVVNAREWQKYFSISGAKEDAYGCAVKLFPDMDLMTERGRILDGRCDALLIAEYGRRRLK